MMINSIKRCRIVIPASILFFMAMIMSANSAPYKGNIMGPKTLGQPSYPSSGSLRNRSNDITGEDTSNSSLMSSDVDPRTSTQVQKSQKEEKEEGLQNGPYDKEGIYHYE